MSNERQPRQGRQAPSALPYDSAVRRLSLGADRPLDVIAIGAHADDLEIGCGGTILRLAGEGRLASVHWLVLSASGPRIAEARAGAEAFLDGIDAVSVDIADFRDGYFPSQYAAIKDRFEDLKSLGSPDLVLVPRRGDLHQDHRLVAELAWNTFRDHVILEYEIPKWDADLTPPNVYVELTRAVIERKAELLGRVFGSQADRHWFDRDLFVGLARVRGMECRAPEGFAEGFHAHKLVW